MKFKDLPVVAKLAIALTFFNAWVMFEEFVIDRFGYWQYLPFYRKGIFCIWDITSIFIISILVFAKWKFVKTKCFLANCKICLDKQ